MNIPQISLQFRVQPQFLLALDFQQHIRRVMWPIQGEADGVGDEEVVEMDFGVKKDHFIAHFRPGDVIHPGRVRGQELGGARGDPVGHVVVGFGEAADRPAHGEEHDVQDRDLFGEVA